MTVKNCFSTVIIFLSNDPATTKTNTLSLHDALPISMRPLKPVHTRLAIVVVAALTLIAIGSAGGQARRGGTLSFILKRSEEHTSELQSRRDLVCRLLLEKKKKKKITRLDCVITQLNI